MLKPWYENTDCSIDWTNDLCNGLIKYIVTPIMTMTVQNDTSWDKDYCQTLSQESRETFTCKKCHLEQSAEKKKKRVSGFTA